MVTASWPWPASATKMRLVSAWSSDVSSSDRSEEHTSELQSLTNLVCRLLLRSEEHTSELQSLTNLVCRLLLEKKTCARSEEHTSELQSLTNLVCRLLLEKQKPGRVPGEAACGAGVSDRVQFPTSRSLRARGGTGEAAAQLAVRVAGSAADFF